MEFGIFLNILRVELLCYIELEVAKVIVNVHEGRVDIRPGYEGEHGVIEVKEVNKKI